MTGSVTLGGEFGTSVDVGSTSDGNEDDDTPAGSDADPGDPGEGVDIGWGDKSSTVSTAYDGSYLSGGLGADLQVTTEPEVEAETAPAVVPDDALTEPGHMTR